jgi:hypothetical protein
MWRLPRALLPIYATTLVDTLGYTTLPRASAIAAWHRSVCC